MEPEALPAAEWDAEDVYDDEISPLMKRLIAICKRHQIPMLAVFQFSGPDEDGVASHVTTSLPLEGRVSSKLDALCTRWREMVPPSSAYYAIAEVVETMPDGSKRVTSTRVG